MPLSREIVIDGEPFRYRIADASMGALRRLDEGSRAIAKDEGKDWVAKSAALADLVMGVIQSAIKRAGQEVTVDELYDLLSERQTLLVMAEIRKASGAQQPGEAASP